jgi:hypothetical protein
VAGTERHCAFRQALIEPGGMIAKRLQHRAPRIGRRDGEALHIAFGQIEQRARHHANRRAENGVAS